MKFLACLALLSFAVVANPQTKTPIEPNSPKPVHLSEDTAAALVTKKALAIYPLKALALSIQGTVVLNVTISETGDVEEVAVASGDPELAKAAIDSMKQWKYKPYVVAGFPVPFETQVSFGFHDKGSPVAPPKPLGRFKDGRYQNEFFGLSYPLSADWIRLSPGQSRVRLVAGEEILLVEAHAPVMPNGWITPSTFVLTTAIPVPEHTDAREDLAGMIAAARAENKAAQDAEVSQFNVAGLSFYRANLILASNQYQTLVCTIANGRLFRWYFGAVSKDAMKKAVETIHLIARVDTRRPNPVATPESAGPAASTSDSHMSLPSEKLAASLRKKVAPDCVGDSSFFGGDVKVNVIVDKEGNVSSIGLAGPSTISVPAAVDAVSKWKYNPLMVNGQAVEVDSTVDLKVPQCRGTALRGDPRRTLTVR